MTRSDRKELSGDGRELTAKLLAETREELVRADGKAQILLAATGVVIGVVAGGIVAGDWKPGDLACGAELLWWIGAGSAAVGVLALVYAIWPRVGTGASDRARYFADVRVHGDCDSLIPVLEKEAQRENRDAEQLFSIASIVGKKYAAVKMAIIALALAVVLTAFAAIVG